MVVSQTYNYVNKACCLEKDILLSRENQRLLFLEGKITCDFDKTSTILLIIMGEPNK